MNTSTYWSVILSSV